MNKREAARVTSGEFPFTTDPQEYFNLRTDKGDGCWPWNGIVMNGGYAYMAMGKRLWVAHRWAFEQLHGKLPKRRLLVRSCEHKHCVNPAHLYLREKPAPKAKLPPKTLEERFWPRVQKTETCWLWTGSRNEWGYGTLCKTKTEPAGLAHRLVFKLSGITIPEGKVVDHICRVRNCVNPKHLRIVTPAENATENSTSPGAINKRKTHCNRGHALEGGNVQVLPHKRLCLICARISYRKYGQKRRAALASKRQEAQISLFHEVPKV
jgi:hypothetical protein